MQEGQERARETSSELARWDAIPDDVVVERIRGGQSALYEILMRRYNQRIYRVALSILQDPAEAEDVMQETYVRAWRYLDQFAGQAKFSTWMTKIAVYEALARLRRRAPMEHIDAVPEGKLQVVNKDDPERQAYDRELRVVLERAIDTLPTGYRSVFVMRLVEGLNVADTAACLDLTEETVKTRLHRARSLLRRELQERAGIVAPQAFPLHRSRCDRVVDLVFERIGGAGPART
jgi:RNA polymerase sigma-70 factor, ECF subfamily